MKKLSNGNVSIIFLNKTVAEEKTAVENAETIFHEIDAHVARNIELPAGSEKRDGSQDHKYYHGSEGELSPTTSKKGTPAAKFLIEATKSALNPDKPKQTPKATNKKIKLLRLFLILYTVFFLSSCSNHGNMNSAYEIKDSLFFNKGNWLILSQKRMTDSSFVPIKLKCEAFEYQGYEFHNSKGVFLRDDNGEYKYLVDFEAKECAERYSIYGNKFFLLQKYAVANTKDECFVYFYKLPYTIEGRNEKDKFILFTSKTYGIVGKSNYKILEDSLQIENFIGDSSFLVKRMTIRKCW